jgi:O-antigen/teichoic acid export membrane protein
MSDTKIFAKNSTVYFIGNLINAGVSFLVIPLLTRILSPSDYGTVNLFLVYSNIASNIICLGSYVPISARFHKVDHSKFRIFFSAALGISIILTALLSIWALYAGFSRQMLIGKTFGMWAPLVSLSAFAQTIIVFFQTLYQTKRKPIQYAMIQVSLSCFGVLITFCLLPIAKVPWMARIIGIVLIQVFISALGFWYFFKTDLLTWEFKQKDLKEVVTLGLPVLPYNLGINFLTQFDQYMVMKVAGAAVLGTYSLGAQIAGVVESAGTAFSRAFTAHVCFSLKDQKKSANLSPLIKSGFLGFIGIVVLAAGVFLFQVPILRFLALPSFGGAESFIPILCLRSIFQTLQYFFASFAIAYEATWALGFAAVVGGLTTIFISTIIAPKYLAVGVAYASVIGTLISFLVTAIIVFFLVQRKRAAL